MSTRFAKVRAALEQARDDSQPQEDLPIKKSGRRRIEPKILKTNEPLVRALKEPIDGKSAVDEESILEEELILEGDSTLEEESAVDKPLSISKIAHTAFLEEKSDSGNTTDDDNQDKPLLRPVFVPKSQRNEELCSIETIDNVENRGKEAHRLLVQLVRQEYEASVGLTVSGNDDEAALKFDSTMVDDTDGLDQEEEYEAWKLRELLRLKRDGEARDRWDLEKMELERIRNLTEEERRKLDEEKMREWLEKTPASSMRFMQKYYHKGAFFMDEDNPLYHRRDYQQPTGEDAAANREMLPEVKQVRDWGKKGRTKWTHLVGEDTTAFDYGWGQRKNEMNYKLIGKMGGMRGHLDNPSAKRPKTSE